MRWIVYLPLLLPILATVTARPLAARLDPRWATWLLTGAAVGLAAASTVALGLLTLTAVIRIPLVASLGHWSRTVLGRDDPSTTYVAVVAGTLLGMAVVAVGSFSVRRYRAFADAFRHARRLPGTGDLVVTEEPAADAYALPGKPGRVVVSQSMLDALDEDGRAALLAHERAHLAGFHYVFTTTARLAATANPLLRPVASAVEYTVERWADERAAEEVGDRRRVARAIATAAIAAKNDPPRRRFAAVLGIGGVRGSAAMTGAGPVPRRVAALLAPPPARSAVLLLAMAAVVACAGLCAIEAARDLHVLLHLANTNDHRR